MVINGNPFVPAKKERIYLRMALVGASGSGKSLTGLQIASQLAALRGGKLAVIDTEGRSARKYADKVNFDVLDLSGNFSPAKYIEAITAAVQYGYTAVLVDSFTHAWNGAGGVLDIVDKASAKLGGNKFAGWSIGRPAQNSLNETLLNAPIDIIGTMRSKTEWAIQPDPKTGKDKPVKIGLAPVQSDDFEYEFDVVAYLDMQHTMTITKSRCSALDGESGLTETEFISTTLHDWLTTGSAPETPAMNGGSDPLAVTLGGRQTPPPAKLLKWHEQPGNLETLAATAYANLWIDERGLEGVKQLETLIAPKTWNDFQSGKEAGKAIEAAANALRKQEQDAKPSVFRGDAPPAPVPDIPATDVKALLNGKHGRSTGNGHTAGVDSPFDLDAPQTNPHTGKVESHKVMTFPQRDTPLRDVLAGLDPAGKE